MVSCAGALPSKESLRFDKYGGLLDGTVPTAGWFRVARLGGRWWLVDPDGHRFLSIGVNNISYTPDTIQGTDQSPYRDAATERYGNREAWAKAVVKRLRGCGFNTIGAWSDDLAWHQQMPYTVILDLAGQVKWPEGNTFPDVFDPAYERAAMAAARRFSGPHADDPWLLGYFTDNELRWGPDWRSSQTLFAEFLALGEGAPGRQAVLRFLEGRYGAIAALNQAWGTQYADFAEIGRTAQPDAHLPHADEDDFLRLVAERYFDTAQRAVRAADSHHMILGCRFAGYAPRPVLEAMRGHVDLVSFNHYDVSPPAALLREITDVTGRPIIISEFSYRGRDSGLPNTRGAGVVVDTQRDRAEHFERYVRELMALPNAVGYHWFEHADEPAEGRFDGENSNYGLVNIHDHPYQVLVETMARVNQAMFTAASAPVKAQPSSERE
jgi:agarase